tara:strand:+ start:2030 stop:2629 length:600 start_codon:yes stop_codon:yes gene_type:complete
MKTTSTFHWGYPVLVCLTAVYLSGCHTLNRKECETADWESIGLRDGLKGETLAHFNKHQKACDRFDLLADRANWESGRRKGLETYCEPVNGFYVGRAGKVYHGVCGAGAAEFRENHRKGKWLFDMESVLNSVEREINNLLDSLDDLEQQHLEALEEGSSSLQQELRLRLLELRRSLRRKQTEWNRLQVEFAAEEMKLKP